MRPEAMPDAGDDNNNRSQARARRGIAPVRGDTMRIRPTAIGFLMSLLLCLPTLVAPAVLAADDDEDASQLDRVEVTGSRIKRVQLEGSNPILTISRADIDRSGASSVGDYLQQLTASGKALNTRFNSSGNFGFPPDAGGVGAGSTQVDLRNLGSKRVLVLVDGKRWVNESSGSGVGGAVDLNTIPLSIIERIEVLLDGASTVYGSDAIAGVVNVITRREVSGTDFRGTIGRYGQGDGETNGYELSMGRSGGRSSLFLSLSYTDVGMVSASDRSISQEPVPGTGVTRGSSATPQGRFVFVNDDDAGGLCDGTTFECDITTANGAVFAGDVPSFPGDFIPFSGALRFNFQPYNLVLTPSERTSAFLQGRQELSDTVSFYAKFLYNTRSSLNRAAPEPIFLGSDAGNGNIGDHVVFDVTNPYNPFGITLDADGGNAFFLTRRPLEGGPRLFSQDVNTYYFGMGIEGTSMFLDHPVDWDLNYAYSRNQASQETRGTYNIAHIVKGVGPLAVCQADPACVPVNFFGGAGGSTLTPDMLDYILAVLHDTSDQEMRILSFNMSTELFELPAGDLGLGIGVEHREQTGSYTPDHLSSSGEANGVPSQPTAGGFDVEEFYVETIVPLVRDAAFAELIELEASGRWSDYSTSGRTSTFKLGGRWQVSDQLLLRVTYAEGFRAPSIGELFGAQSRFDAAISDPCSGVNGASTQALQDSCQALGVPIDGSYTQPNPQISVLTGGSTSLDPETSDSFTWGVIYQPSWASSLPWTRSLDLELNVYDYTVDGAIGAVDAQTQLDGCVSINDSAIDPVLCSGINRTSNGVIVNFDNTLVNLTSIETSGWDVSFSWRLEDGPLGSFLVTWRNSFVTDYTTADITGVNQLEGREFNDGAIPEWMSNLVVDWRRGDWSASWSMRMIDGVTESCSDFLDGSPNSLTALGLCSDPASVEADSKNRLGTMVYNDLQLGYDLGRVWDIDTVLKFGVNNLFDRDPPICLSCSLNGYDAGTYEVPGRFMYLSVAGRFE
jgi:iron complex outermembrane receptor protein